MIRGTDLPALVEADVVDRDGERIGTVRHVYSSEDGSQPLFVTVRTAADGVESSLVPLEAAELREGALHVAFDGATIAAAPVIDADDGISDDERGTVFDYYDSAAGGEPSGVEDQPAGLSSRTGAEVESDLRDGAERRAADDDAPTGRAHPPAAGPRGS